jgi:hypothetical protein
MFLLAGPNSAFAGYLYVSGSVYGFTGAPDYLSSSPCSYFDYNGGPEALGPCRLQDGSLSFTGSVSGSANYGVLKSLLSLSVTDGNWAGVGTSDYSGQNYESAYEAVQASQGSGPGSVDFTFTLTGSMPPGTNVEESATLQVLGGGPNVTSTLNSSFTITGPGTFTTTVDVADLSQPFLLTSSLGTSAELCPFADCSYTSPATFDGSAIIDLSHTAIITSVVVKDNNQQVIPGATVFGLDSGTNYDDITESPEPSTLLLLGGAFAAIGLRRGRP